MTNEELADEVEEARDGLVDAEGPWLDRMRVGLTEAARRLRAQDGERIEPVAWQQKDRFDKWTQIDLEYQPIEWWEKYGPVRALILDPQEPENG